MATEVPSAGVGEASAEEYQAYETVVQAVSAGISEGVKDALKKLATQEEFSQAQPEMGGSSGEAALDPEVIYGGFWKLWKGLDCELRWRSGSGVAQKSALVVDQVRDVNPETGGEEITIMGSVSPFSLGVSW